MRRQGAVSKNVSTMQHRSCRPGTYYAMPPSIPGSMHVRDRGRGGRGGCGRGEEEGARGPAGARAGHQLDTEAVPLLKASVECSMDWLSAAGLSPKRLLSALCLCPHVPPYAV